MNTTTQKARLIRAFENGQDFSANQLAQRFGVANPTATINYLRRNGYAIYANRKTNQYGEKVTRYRLGTPTRSLVASGYYVLGATVSGLTA